MVENRILVNRDRGNTEKGIYPTCSKGEDCSHILKCGARNVCRG
jgi:hypothetical protein